jgi:hypothetical protein
VADLDHGRRSGCGHRISQAFSSVERVVHRTGTLDGTFADREAMTVRQANRAAKFTVIGLGCVLLAFAVVALAILAFTMLLVHGRGSNDAGMFRLAGSGIVWTALAGIAAIVVAFKTTQPGTTSAAGLVLFVLGMVPPVLVIVSLIATGK